MIVNQLNVIKQKVALLFCTKFFNFKLDPKLSDPCEEAHVLFYVSV